jgi:hypothetical protein
MLSSDQSQGSAFFSPGRTLLGRALLIIVLLPTFKDLAYECSPRDHQ